MTARLSPKNRLKRPDEFITLSSRLLSLVSRHYKWGLAVLLALGLAVFGWGLYQQSRTTRMENATNQLARLQTDISRPEAAASAQAALEKLAGSEPGSGPALLAQIYRAHLLFQEKKYGEAAALYEVVKGHYLGLDSLLAENLSYCYEAQQQFLPAAEALSSLVQNAPLPFRTDYLRRQAYLFELGGQRQKAAANYRQLLAQQPNPLFASYFQEKIARLEAP